MNEDGWKAVAEAVAERMKDLGLSKRRVSTLGGPSGPTLDKILGGEPVVRSDALVGLATALEWPPRAVEMILDGADPATFAEPAEGALTRIEALEAQMAEVLNRLNELEWTVPLDEDEPVAGSVVELKRASGTGMSGKRGKKAHRPSPDPEPEGP